MAIVKFLLTQVIIMVFVGTIAYWKDRLDSRLSDLEKAIEELKRRRP